VTGLVLAAGIGKRLAPLTEERPKGLIELGGRSLLQRLLDGLHAAGVQQTAIVVGYRQDQIRAALGDSHRGMPLRYVVNRDFEKGPRLSLWAGRAELEPQAAPGMTILADFSVNLMRDLQVAEGQDLAIALPPESIRVFPRG